MLRDRPGQHRHARAQPDALRRRSCAPPQDPELRRAGPLARGDRHQRRRAVLHGQRAADAPGRPDGRQPPHAGAGPRHRGARGDGGRLPVHHAVGRRRGEVLPHQGHLDLGQGEVHRRHPRLVRPEARGRDRPRDRADGGRGLSGPQPRAGPDPGRAGADDGGLLGRGHPGCPRRHARSPWSTPSPPGPSGARSPSSAATTRSSPRTSSTSSSPGG